MTVTCKPSSASTSAPSSVCAKTAARAYLNLGRHGTGGRTTVTALTRTLEAGAEVDAGTSTVNVRPIL